MFLRQKFSVWGATVTARKSDDAKCHFWESFQSLVSSLLINLVKIGFFILIMSFQFN